MNVWQMWKSNAVTLLFLIVLNLALFSLGDLPWIALGCLLLLLAGFLNYRQGAAMGHEACSIRQTVEKCSDPDSPAYGQLDQKVIARAWKRETGIRGTFLSVAIPLGFGVLYILCTLLKIEPLVLPTRVVSWLLNLPFWPIIIHWQPAFDALTVPIGVVLLLAPFALPLCTFVGFMQGPRLWQRSEMAMAQGRRRAKARSRVGKKTVPKPRKPEI